MWPWESSNRLKLLQTVSINNFSYLLPLIRVRILIWLYVFNWFIYVCKNIISEAQKGVDIAKQVFGRKTMEENNGGEQLQVAGDCDQGQNNAENVKGAKFFVNPFSGK